MPIKIDRAIPLRRYRLGEFEAVILHEIESPDAVQYHYLLALVADGEAEPVLYISCERNTTGEGNGQYLIRVMSGEQQKMFGPSDAWQNIDQFAEDALQMAQRVMQLSDEEPMRML